MMDYWDDPLLYIQTFLGGDFEKLKGKITVLDFPFMNNIMNVCTAGYQKGKAKTENKEIKNAIEERIAKRKKRMIEQGLVVEEESPKSKDNDLLWVATIMMKGDISQPYESIMQMTLTEIFGMFDRLKIMDEKREKNRKNKKKKNSGTGRDINEINIPTLGGRK